MRRNGPSGTICTWAGNGIAGYDGDGHELLESSFYWPVDVVETSNGTIYITDWNNHRIRQVTAEGTLETVIGTNIPGDGPDEFSEWSDWTPPGAPSP